LRLVGNLAFWWLCRLIWPRADETLAIAAAGFAVLSPATVSSQMPVSYSTDLIAHAAALNIDRGWRSRPNALDEFGQSG